MSSGTDEAHPPSANTTPTAESRSRKRGMQEDKGLPPGWTTEVRTRTSGTKAGVVDKYYCEPVTGRKFRSKNEVMYYLEHGTTKRLAKKAQNGHTLSEHSEGKGINREKTKSDKKGKEQPPKPLNFDFLNVPDKVIWTGTIGSEQAWWPFIGDYKVQESVSQDWDRAFTLVTSQSDG